MKVLVIGGGGREHAIAWRLAQEPGVVVSATPGNPGMATIGACIQPPNATPHGFLAVAQAQSPDLTVVGPEAPLVAGVTDLFRAHGFTIFGPSQAAAQLEGSKAYAKAVMNAAGIPTARYQEINSVAEGRAALDRFGTPVVLKADGLAAGKGVVIAADRHEAEAALQSLTSTIGARIVIEEFLIGEEASFIAICDGKTAIPLQASQDHKRIFDDDLGPNTGGMGAYCDGRILSAYQASQIMDTVIQPTLDYMARIGTPFKGFLYAGIMMTSHGPQVLEFNVRLGDPETQCLLHNIESSFASSLLAAAKGDVSRSKIEWRSDPSVCVVLAAKGYPEKPTTGTPITGIADAESTGAVVFHAGTRSESGNLVTSGGRVLGVTASGPDLPAAIANTYAAAGRIHFEGMQYRKDIGKKGLKRW